MGTVAFLAYLVVGVVLALLAGWTMLARYRAEVWRPATELHGQGEVAVAEDIAILVALGAAVLLFWLPMAVIYAVAKGSRLLSGRRARENNPNPAL